MRVPLAGSKARGLLIAPDCSDRFGEIDETLSPDRLYDLLGTVDIGVCTRYIGPVPLLIMFDRGNTEDSTPTVHGPDGEVSIRGNVLVFGRDPEGSFKSLSDFEVGLLKSHTDLVRCDGKTYFALSDVTKNPVPMSVIG
jgi:hypothetical protein